MANAAAAYATVYGLRGRVGPQANSSHRRPGSLESLTLITYVTKYFVTVSDHRAAIHGYLSSVLKRKGKSESSTCGQPFVHRKCPEN